MSLTVEAVYENGVLKPAEPLPLEEHEKVSVTIQTAVSRARQSAGMIPWTGSIEDLDYLIEDVENDPLNNLASKDGDFDRVPGLTRYAPV